MKDPIYHREAETEYTGVVRWVHWLRFFSIAILTCTGFYIASVFIAPMVSSEPVLFMHAKMRMVHLIFGFLLLGLTIFKTYYFFASKSKIEKLERMSFKSVFELKTWVDQIKYYLLIGKHPQLHGVYNPLQTVAYMGLYALMVILCLTGLIMYAHIYHNGLGGFLSFLRPIEALMGGLAPVRMVHHIATWAVMIFLLGHVYMVIFNSIKGKEGGLDSIVSGIKFKKSGH
ncbi:MAG: Ni/Fe-hydrogenase, b-type cytochrome subunit [Helicobacteraceae bacterium]|jgi:Ni/Fe-hydrogenase 1 B-type cytochrome subunit|nr:Ni/Fe-hydrogenase, b-type cytochrome subunit [Helicobacteraceae bacterium]